MIKKNTHWRYGILIGIIIICTLILLSVSGLEKIRRAILIPNVLLLAGLLLNAIAFSKINNRRVSFTEVFKSCFKTTCIISFLVIIYYYVNLSIHPDLIQTDPNFTRAADVLKQMNSEDRETLKYISPVSTGVAYLVSGTAFCIIAAAIVKKKKDISAPAEVI